MQTLRTVGTCLLLAATMLPAQRPSSWVTDATPNVPVASIGHLGKLTWFLDSGILHVFSSATRSWSLKGVSLTASVRNTNDIVLVVDGTSISAFSSARGRFETLQVSAQASVINSPSNRNDGVILVIDGTTLSWFSGFNGRWQQRAVSPTASFEVQRNTALMIEGADLAALSALRDDWVTHRAAAPITHSGVGDTVGWASDGVRAYGYSAIRDVWTSAPLPAGAAPTPNSQSDIAIWSSPAELLGFSGVRGQFALAATGEPTSITTEDHLAHAVTPDLLRHWLFSVPLGTWTALQTAQPAVARLDAAVALLLEPTVTHGYSASTGGVSSLSIAATNVGTNTAVAAAINANSGELQLFSGLTQSWHPAPAAARRSIPQLSRSGALLSDGGRGSWVFSARSGSFVARTTGTNPTFHFDAGSALLAVEDDGALAVFDPRREVWVATPLRGGDRPLRVAIWRTTLVATTPTEAIGFGVLHGTLERTPLPGVAVDLIASSEVGSVVTASAVLGYSPVPDVRTEAQFPEFRRMLARGSTIDLKFVGRSGAAVGALLGLPGPGGIAIGGWGEFTLAPGNLLPLPPALLDNEGRLSVPLRAPDLPVFAGVEIAFQALFVPAAQAPYLSRMGTFRIAEATSTGVAARRSD